MVYTAVIAGSSSPPRRFVVSTVRVLLCHCLVACSRVWLVTGLFIHVYYSTSSIACTTSNREHKRRLHIILQADPKISKTWLFVVTLSQSCPVRDQPIAQPRMLWPTDVAFVARSVRPLTIPDMPPCHRRFFFSSGSVLRLDCACAVVSLFGSV